MSFTTAHPYDLIGADALSQRLFGADFEVLFEGETEFTSGADAQSKLDARRRALDANIGARDSLNPDTFTVAMSKVVTPHGTAIGGGATFARWFAGQTNPTDLANLEFQLPACVELLYPSTNTQDIYGNVTGLGSLRSANVAQKAPVWNIADHTTNFIPQAAYAGVGIFLDQSNCGPGVIRAAAAFNYKAIEGGSILSVSVGWGAFSVSIGGGTLELQKSTPPIYFNI
ncbi:hypothetical protein [Plantibacter sp. RU18]|uniref:hypothetical protein n=1 Tax=Plantibacter sp. RU18 TaxID=3158143 RepID=UPI003D36DC0E